MLRHIIRRFSTFKNDDIHKFRELITKCDFKSAIIQYRYSSYKDDMFGEGLKIYNDNIFRINEEYDNIQKLLNNNEKNLMYMFWFGSCATCCTISTSAPLIVHGISAIGTIWNIHTYVDNNNMIYRSNHIIKKLKEQNEILEKIDKY